jgi:hypothetical protein
MDISGAWRSFIIVRRLIVVIWTLRAAGGTKLALSARSRGPALLDPDRGDPPAVSVVADLEVGDVVGVASPLRAGSAQAPIALVVGRGSSPVTVRIAKSTPATPSVRRIECDLPQAASPPSCDDLGHSSPHVTAKLYAHLLRSTG